MRYFDRTVIAIVLVAALSVIACRQSESGAGKGLSPGTMMSPSAPNSTRVGVFARTSDGIQELTSFGEQLDSDRFKVPDVATIPKSNGVSALFINMPDSIVTNSKVFWDELERGRPIHLKRRVREDKLSAIPFQIHHVDGNMYALESVELENCTYGVLAVKVQMPLGTPDRLYFLLLAD